MIKSTLVASYLDLNISESHFSYQLLRGSVTKKMQRFEESLQREEVERNKHKFVQKVAKKIILHISFG